MTARIEKTVFISYRRTNMPWALAIYQSLTSQGYDVFFDYLSIPSGDFEKIIIENIKARAHFVVVLTPSALERCSEPGDWLRREIETAMDEKRNIVPLMLESFDFGNPSTTKALTGKLENLKKYNGLRVHSDYFFEGMERLRVQFLNVQLDGVLHPLNAETIQATEKQQTAATNASLVQLGELTVQELYERGHKHINADEFHEAIHYLNETLSRNPEFAPAYFLRGVARDKIGDSDGAFQDWDEAIQLKLEIPEIYSVRAAVRSTRGDIDGAIEDYTEAIKLAPNDLNLYLFRSGMHFEKGNLDSAIDDLNSITTQGCE